MNNGETIDRPEVVLGGAALPNITAGTTLARGQCHCTLIALQAKPMISYPLLSSPNSYSL
jgi:hypothetical protein